MIFRQLFDRETCTYTYLLADEATREAVMIDTVDTQVRRDLTLLEELDLNLTMLLETHIHADHITGSGALREATGAVIAVPSSAEAVGADLRLAEGDILRFGKHRIKVLEMPGHTADCRCFIVDEAMVFTGDVLFIRGTGRTDFQGGSAATLYRNITQKLFTLADHVRVYPGHDYRGHTVSTIGEEKRHNPRLAGKSEAAFIAIMDGLNLANPKRIQEAVPGNQSCGMGAVKAASFDGMDVNPAWVADHLDKLHILDVRGEDEYRGKEGHIPGALLIPLPQLEQRLSEVPRGKTLVVNCHAGGRSMKAVKLMRGQGFTNVWNLKGGILAWNKNHYPNGLTRN